MGETPHIICIPVYKDFLGNKRVEVCGTLLGRPVVSRKASGHSSESTGEERHLSHAGIRRAQHCQDHDVSPWKAPVVMHLSTCAVRWPPRFVNCAPVQQFPFFFRSLIANMERTETADSTLDAPWEPSSPPWFPILKPTKLQNSSCMPCLCLVLCDKTRHETVHRQLEYPEQSQHGRPKLFVDGYHHVDVFVCPMSDEYDNHRRKKNPTEF